MKRNLSQLLQTPPEGGHSKEAYDLHNWEIFHSKGGQFSVVSCRETVPNSDYKMSVDAITRSMLCNTANFANIKENWYFIHVPLSLICNNAYQFLVQRRQSYSSLSQNIDQFPVFNLGAVVSKCLEICTYDKDEVDKQDYFDLHGFNIGMNALRLLDMTGYGCYIDMAEFILAATGEGGDTIADRLEYMQQNIYVNITSKGIKPSVARIGAYQCAWYNFFRNDIYDNTVDASIYNFDDVTVLTASDPNYDVTEVRGVVDFIKRNLRLHYVQNKKDMFMGCMPGTQFGPTATIPMATDLSFVFSGVTGSESGKYGLRENTSTVVGDPKNTWVNFIDDANGTMYRTNEDGDESNRIYHTHAMTGLVSIDKGYSLFDVLTLVESQAIQKWRQKSMLAGNKTIDQFRAHHGVVPRHLIDHTPDFIGSVDNIIHIQEITSQANTLDANEGQNNLGELRGRGYGASDLKEFHFHSDDYGILMLCHSIVVENTYSSYGLDYGNTLVYYSDFFQQEFQNTGLQAVPKFLANALAGNAYGTYNAHGDGAQGLNPTAALFGYYAKNYGIKEYTDKVHGLFNPIRWTMNHRPDDRFGYADLESFVITRDDMVGKGGTSVDYTFGDIYWTVARIYQSPRIFDSIFAFDADDHFDTDQFFTKARFQVDALLPMTKLGLANF